MKVLLTFDIEIWCDGWDRLDEKFPAAFERYVYGRSSQGDFALPRTLEILGRNGLRGVFFIESLFAARFGLEPLKTIVELIGAGGHDIQLHLHPEWTDEITPPPVACTTGKRPSLHQYPLEDQLTLLTLGRELLERAGGGVASSFRAGSFAANSDTLEALRTLGFVCDFSIDSTMPESVPDLRGGANLFHAQEVAGIKCYPMSAFRDGFGSIRHAQVGACSASELIEAMEAARTLGWQQFVILSHNFEMLRPGSSQPNLTVAARFESLCEHLGRRRNELANAVSSEISRPLEATAADLPRVSVSSTLRRHYEQAKQRIL